MEALSELQFHAELAGVFRSLRDLHTVYQLPDPYRGHVATLGFLIERYADPDGTPHYLVTHVDAVARARRLRGRRRAAALERGADRARRRAQRRAAGRLQPRRAHRPRPGVTDPAPAAHRAAARRALGADRVPHRRRTAARDAHPLARPRGRDARRPPAGPGLHHLGRARHRRRQRGHAADQARAVRARRGRARADAIALRSVLDHGRRRIGGRSVGYLRIFSFNVSSARRFAEQVARHPRPAAAGRPDRRHPRQPRRQRPGRGDDAAAAQRRRRRSRSASRSRLPRPRSGCVDPTPRSPAGGSRSAPRSRPASSTRRRSRSPIPRRPPRACPATPGQQC